MPSRVERVPEQSLANREPLSKKEVTARTEPTGSMTYEPRWATPRWEQVTPLAARATVARVEANIANQSYGRLCWGSCLLLMALSMLLLGLVGIPIHSHDSEPTSTPHQAPVSISPWTPTPEATPTPTPKPTEQPVCGCGE